MVRRSTILGVAGLLLLGGFGCKHCKHHKHHGSDRALAPRVGDGMLRAPESATDPYIPSPGLPPAGRVLPPSTGSAPSATDLPAPYIPESRSNRIDPLNPKRELLLPQGEAGATFPEAKSDQGLLGSPRAADGSRESKKVAEPGIADLKGYTKVKPGISNGRVPTAAGFDKLKKAGFKTVVYLHSPNADVESVRRDAEGKGLAFVSLPVSPEKLAEAVRSFNDHVAQKTNQPVYVCDEDGTRTGSLWYVYFRTIEYTNDDAARLLAGPLGLVEPPSAEQTTFWVAIRNYLATR
jgi:protein tyrosine phosphatase (PTP) superfamily phosphohydrolase (DUF442 family)